MIKINDVELPIPTRELVDYLRSALDPSYMLPWMMPRSWPGLGLSAITFPTAYRPLPPLRISRFYWPRGAMRWSYGHFLADSEQAERIRTVAFGDDGTQLNTVTLSLASPGEPPSDDDEQLDVEMYVMPPTPLINIVHDPNTGIENLYLISVVDERYYWWYKQVPDFGMTDSGAVTWEDLYGMIGTALGVIIDVDPIDPDYLRPDPSFGLRYEAIPPVLDAVAYNVGHRIIRKYDGSVVSQSFDNAVQTADDDFANNPQRTIRAGGVRFEDEL
jgi:hypothetical protein